MRMDPNFGLAGMISGREPEIQMRVDQLRARHPHFTNDQLALDLIRSTRRRVAGKYYGPGDPGARPLLLAGEDAAHVKVGR